MLELRRSRITQGVNFNTVCRVSGPKRKQYKGCVGMAELFLSFSLPLMQKTLSTNFTVFYYFLLAPCSVNS